MKAFLAKRQKVQVSQMQEFGETSLCRKLWSEFVRQHCGENKLLALIAKMAKIMVNGLLNYGTIRQ